MKSLTNVYYIIRVVSEGEGLAEVGGSKSVSVLLWNPQSEIESEMTSLAEGEIDSPRD